ncbi:MAG: SpaA isopeptide-forming pilin-related protein, partial [Fimbriiglobus sp.]
MPAIVPLFNTGQTDTGVIGDNATDPHFTVTYGTQIDKPVKAITADGFPIRANNRGGPWLANDDNSRWIVPAPADADGRMAVGTYTFTTTFDLTGYDLSTAAISGKWSADNWGQNVILNDVPLGISHTGPLEGVAQRGFDRYSDLNIASGFKAGINTLEFVVVNDRISATNGRANPIGLRLDDLSLTAEEYAPGVVSGMVYLDLPDWNGEMDGEEVYLSGASVALYTSDGSPAIDANGNLVSSVQTAADGMFSFPNMPSGEYTVRVDAPDGYALEGSGRRSWLGTFRIGQDSPLKVAAYAQEPANNPPAQPQPDLPEAPPPRPTITLTPPVYEQQPAARLGKVQPVGGGPVPRYTWQEIQQAAGPAAKLG